MIWHTCTTSSMCILDHRDPLAEYRIFYAMQFYSVKDLIIVLSPGTSTIRCSSEISFPEMLSTRMPLVL